MSDARWTPGPWAHAVADGWVIRHPVIYADAGSIANATFLGPSKLDELNANARLISAAPELYAALQSAYEYLDAIPETAAGGDDEAVRIARMARAALAKARGEA